LNPNIVFKKKGIKRAALQKINVRTVKEMPSFPTFITCIYVFRL
jgi:hypothetical protein